MLLNGMGVRTVNKQKCRRSAKTDLIYTVAQLPQLVYPGTSLDVWVVSCTDSAHAGGFITSIALCTIFKV